MADFFLFLHHLDQFIRDLLGIAVEDSYPPKPADAAQLSDQPVQRLLPVQVLPVECGLLGYKDQLLHSLRGQLFRFPDQPLHGNTPVISPDLWDNAVGTVLVAALSDLQVGKVPARRHQPLCIRQRQRVDIRQHDRVFPCKRRVHRVQNPVICRRPQHFIHLRDLIQDLLPVPLRQAACDDERPGLSLFLIFRHLKDVLDTLFLGVMDKAAGVDDDDVRLCLIIRHLISPRRKQAEHHLCVHQVLVAPEGDKQYLHIRPPSLFFLISKRADTSCASALFFTPLLLRSQPKSLISPDSVHRSRSRAASRPASY